MADKTPKGPPSSSFHNIIPSSEFLAMMRSLAANGAGALPPTPADSDYVKVGSAAEEKKDEIYPVTLIRSPGTLGYLREQLAVMHGGFTSRVDKGWVTCKVTLSNHSSLTSTAGGIIAAALAASPAITSFTSWSTFNTLFDELKCVGLRVQFVPVAGASTGAIFAVGSLISTSGASPSSVADVLSCPDANLVAVGSTAPLGHIHKMRYPKDLLYATIAAPQPGPFAGCPGSIRIYGQNFGATTRSIEVNIRATFIFRGRV
jgi:hypothetical protein